MNTDIQKAVYRLLRSQPFVGNLLQEMTIRSSELIPTAALMYNKHTNTFGVEINNKFFQEQSSEGQVAILIHELMHFTNGHVFRWETLGSEKEQKIRNIAADCSINQYIQNLPEGCVDVAQFKDAEGTPFPLYQTMEHYYTLINETIDKQQQGKGDGIPKMWQQILDQGEFDQHLWDELSEEEKQRMLQEARALIKRTVEKTTNSYSTVPEGIRDLLTQLDSQINALDYKGLLKKAIKRSLCAPERTNSWHRPNKRFGNYAPGTTHDKLPFLNFYVDFSGSISVKEANAFLSTANGFLGAGKMKHCNIGFWHTELYLPKKVRKYRANSELTPDDVQSGGTEPMCVLEHIKETHPNLSIILTDGHYGGSDVKITDKIIWIISENGNLDHPYKHIGLTLPLKFLL